MPSQGGGGVKTIELSTTLGVGSKSWFFIRLSTTLGVANKSEGFSIQHACVTDVTGLMVTTRLNMVLLCDSQIFDSALVPYVDPSPHVHHM